MHTWTYISTSRRDPGATRMNPIYWQRELVRRIWIPRAATSASRPSALSRVRSCGCRGDRELPHLVYGRVGPASRRWRSLRSEWMPCQTLTVKIHFQTRDRARSAVKYDFRSDFSVFCPRRLGKDEDNAWPDLPISGRTSRGQCVSKTADTLLASSPSLLRNVRRSTSGRSGRSVTNTPIACSSDGTAKIAGLNCPNGEVGFSRPASDRNDGCTRTGAGTD